MALPDDSPRQGTDMTIREFQQFIRDQYYARDSRRGTPGTFMWFIEEIGELSSALAGDDKLNTEEEFADVLAWLATLANVVGVNLDEAIRAKYGSGCPDCGQLVCKCNDKP